MAKLQESDPKLLYMKMQHSGMLTRNRPIPNPNLQSMARFPILPIKRLLHYKFPTYSYINEVQCPITIFHGTEDGVVNYEHGKRLFDHITSPHKTFVTIPEGRHNDLVNFKEYTGAIEKAFKKR